MRNIVSATVTAVHHWNDTLFSFKTTREPSFRFESGQFVMIGLEVDGRPLMRAYSIASPHYEEELEFFSIKVPDGALTSRLQNINVGDPVMLTVRPAGTLVPGYLIPGKHLYLLSTGTGLAPFMSIIRDPFIYDSFDKIVLVHGTRWRSELAYQHEIEQVLPDNPYFGEEVRAKLIYYPTVTREDYVRNGVPHQGRITDLLDSGKLLQDIGMPALNPEHDRFMLCGNDAMLQQLMGMLDQRGFVKANSRTMGHYVIEQAFIEK
ncbi:MAG: ferredoxin--NADP(+) reductase [Alteromonadaceae bacterium]|uniref:ferredoxin--NADP(+) reductase n=1 Tax=Rheinheimera aquimaris TaxID=412437 RepID=A0ABN1E521_9GAMM|nr:ferredoxin--NADP reductase [Rheinheimera aquimaris]MBJ91504.1 ferredoxin--NADP(+) reductase [Alteromonadaceae bacterium]MCB5214480.1 ferredoxin--NADP reductase [Rheinheimera aquimaris]|tara:strand:+ start:1426 stop:2214 length:789 start_codon:yes stop_codon:yes gene_type:complete